MRLVVVGANGRTGRILTQRALERGLEVTALVLESSEADAPREHLRVVHGDILVPGSLPSALEGQDAIVSLVAPHPRRNGRVYVEGTRNLADAAAAAGVRRLVVVSAEGAGVSPTRLPLFYRLVLRIPVVARLYPDIAQMETDLMARTDVDWTVVRAAILSDGPRTGVYRTVVGDVVPGGGRISRADLAEFLLTVVETDDYVKQRVALAY
jgi:putative NADH-flavin reductase